jgi:hypothetical protein
MRSGCDVSRLEADSGSVARSQRSCPSGERRSKRGGISLENRGCRLERGGRTGGRRLQRSSPVAERRCKAFGNSVFRSWSDRCWDDSALGATYVDHILLKISRNSCRPSWDSAVGLDVGKGCVGGRQASRQGNHGPAGAGADDRAGTSRAAMAGPAARCLPTAPHRSLQRSSATLLWPRERKFGDNQGQMCGT